MHDRADGWIRQWPLVGALVVGIATCALLADRSVTLYGFVAAAIVSGGILYVLHRRCTPRVRTVVAVAVLLRLIVFAMSPGLSDDAYRYVWDGRIQHEGLNPYSRLPSEILPQSQDEELYERINSSSFHSVYPPLSQIIFFAGSWIPVKSWRIDYYAIKLIICIIEFVSVLVLLRLVGSARAMLYAWNPVVVIEVAGQGHTEGLAVSLLLVGVLLIRRSRHELSAAAITAAGMVKLVPFLALPFLWRRGGWRAVGSSLLVGVVLAWPYLATGVVSNVIESLRLYVSYFEFNAGVYYATKRILLALTGQDLSKTIGPFFAWLFVALLPAIYLLEKKRNWPLEQALIVLLSTFLLLSTTVHPWYVVPLLGLVALEERIRWHWYWMSVLSAGTYLLYVGGPYWLFVWLAWGTWVILAFDYHGDSVLQRVQRRRAEAKWRFIAPWIEGSREPEVLDLGAAEGYVGLVASQEVLARVTLADVVNLNRTTLPFRQVDETSLPFDAAAFDFVILYFVLHHTSDPQAVLRESVRVARVGVVVVESVYDDPVQHRVLRFLDAVANRIRSHGLMNTQAENLQFRRRHEWRSMFDEMGLVVEGERCGGNWIHKKAAFLLSG